MLARILATKIKPQAHLITTARRWFFNSSKATWIKLAEEYSNGNFYRYAVNNVSLTDVQKNTLLHQDKYYNARSFLNDLNLKDINQETLNAVLQHCLDIQCILNNFFQTPKNKRPNALYLSRHFSISLSKNGHSDWEYLSNRKNLINIIKFLEKNFPTNTAIVCRLLKETNSIQQLVALQLRLDFLSKLQNPTEAQVQFFLFEIDQGDLEYANGLLSADIFMNLKASILTNTHINI